MHYAIQHTTRFRYSAPITENVMEVRLQPRSDTYQQCLNFQLVLRPTARVYQFRDYVENVIHYFDIAAAHRDLSITANSVVNVLPPTTLPNALSMDSWAAVDALVNSNDNWEWIQPSTFTPAPRALHELATEFGVARDVDPLTAVLRITRQIHETFTYDTESTRVDSPIEEPLQQRRGVCQDYTHIMLALLRHLLRVPCRYVSGYLFHRYDDHSADDATHAWAEVLLPELGWIGFDPTNNISTGERHIRVALGRDYSDVPPTHGFFRGDVESELSVSVQVRKTAAPLPVQEEEVSPRWHYVNGVAEGEGQLQQQQQQQ